MSPNPIMSPPLTFEIADLEHLKIWVKNHKDLFVTPAIFLLKGDLSAGKTTLVASVVQELDPKVHEVSSPTFALHHRYNLKNSIIDHMDLYRLKNDEDLASSGFFEFLEEDKNTFFIEWSDRLPLHVFLKKRPVYEIHLKKISEVARVLELTRFA